jgi:hypothetical protein
MPTEAEFFLEPMAEGWGAHRAGARATRAPAQEGYVDADERRTREAVASQCNLASMFVNTVPPADVRHSIVDRSTLSRSVR